MQIKTVTTIDGINAVDFGNTPNRFYWIKNIGDTCVHVSALPACTADADNVAILPVGETVMLENYDSVIYVLGAGKVEIYETEYNICPFKVTKKGGESDDKGKYISNGLIKSIALEGIDTTANILILNASDIVLSEEMTIECCAMYSGFDNSYNKGRFFSLCNGYALIGMSMYNNRFEAAMSTDVNTGWAIENTTNITVELNEFVTLAITSDSNGTQFYKNGILHGNYGDNIVSRAGDIVNTMGIKRDFNRTDRNLIGNVYMLRFYDRILSTSELHANAQTDIRNFM